MINATKRLLRSLLLVLTVSLGLMSAPGGAAGQEIEGLQGGAAPAIEAQVRRENLRYPEVNIFYGDLTGQGTNDAISFVYYDAGGSAPRLTTWIWREADGAYTFARNVSIDEVFGLDPRDVKFSPGRIAVTTTVPQGNDPHCCPTGKRTFTIEAGASSVVENKPVASTPSSGNWIATPQSHPGKVGITGTATDGVATFSGGCNPSMRRGFMGSLYGYGGEKLQRIDDQSEGVTFEVGGRAGTKVFAENMHYFAPEEAWVITGGLPVDFLDAFARGDTLTIRNGKGEEAVSFVLSGSAKAVQALRPNCGS
jgi:hypothetical protein